MNRTGCLLLLLVVVLLPMYGVASHRPVDLAVAAIEVTGPQPRWINGSVEDTRIRVTVANHGSEAAGYTLRYYWGQVRDENFLNGDETSSMDVSRQPVPAQGSVQHNATWRVQPWQRGSGSVIAVLELAGDGHTNNNIRSLSFAVPVHDLRARWDDVSDNRIRLDELRFFRLVVENSGTSDESVDLSPFVSAGDPGRFEHSLDQNVMQLPAGGIARTTFWVEFPFDGDASPATITYRAAAHNPDVDGVWTVTGGLQLVSVDAPYDGTYEYDVGPVGQAKRFVPAGEPTVFSLQLRNTGDRDDSYRIDAENDAGWPVAFAPQVVALRPGESSTISVQVEPPSDVTPGTPSVLSVQVEPDHPVAPAKTIEFPIRTEGPLVEIVDIDMPARVYEDENVPTSVVLKNVGTQPSVGGVLHVSAEPFVATMETSFPVDALKPGQRTTVDFDADWRGGAGPATLHATWEPDDPTDELGHESSASLFLRVANLSVAAPAALTGVPGQEVGYLNEPHLFVVRNDGNAPETITLEVESEAGTARLVGSPVLRLAAGESRTVGLEHPIPLPWKEGDTSVILTAALVNRTDVNASAEAVTNVVDGAPPTVRFHTPPPRFWDPRGPLRLHIESSDDTRVGLVTLTVVDSDGTTDEKVVSDPPSPWSTSLTLVPGNHTLEATATDGAGRTATTGPIWVEVRPFPEPRILSHAPADRDNVTRNASLAVLVADELPVTVHARVDDGAEVPLETRPGPGGTVNATGRLDAEPGDHTVTVRVRNAAGRINETTWQVTVENETGPGEDATAQDEGAGGDATLPSLVAPVALAALIVAALRHRSKFS